MSAGEVVWIPANGEKRVFSGSSCCKLSDRSSMQVRILAVDDLEDNLKVLQGLLAQFLPEADVVTALGGKAGLKAARTAKPDVILLDAKMPDLDGFEMCRRVKSDPGTANIPVLMISGVYVDAEHRVTGLESGADGYICKPYQAQEMIAQVKALLRIKKGEDRIRQHEVELEKELEERSGELKESEGRFRMLFEDSPEAILVHGLKGSVLDVNRSACRLYEKEREELLRLNITDLVPPDQKTKAIEDFTRLAQGKIERLEDFNTLAAGRTVLVDIMARKINYGGQPAVLVHARDVSDRKRIEEALREVAQGVSASTGFSFFYSLVQHLSRALKVDYVILGELQPDKPEELLTLAVFAKGEIADNFAYMIEGTPCKKILETKEIVGYPRGMKRRFPKSLIVTTWGVEGYIGAPLTESGGKCVGVLAVMHDKPIEDPQLARTLLQIFASRAAAELERKKAAEELWESEEKYRSLADDVLDTSSIGTAILDAQMEVIWANQAFEQFFGLERDQIIGRKKEEFIDQMKAVLENPGVFERELQDGGERIPGSELIEFHVLPGKDREERWLEHWTQPIRSGLYVGGRIEHYADITPRKRTEAERNRLAMAIEQTVEAVIITDINGIIQYVNPAFEQITGYDRDEAIGQTPRILKSGRHDEKFYSEMWETLSAGGVWTGRVTNQKKDETVFEAEAVISPIRNAEGRTVSYVEVCRDVTREVQLEDQLRQSQKMESVGRLAGGIAHDFNNLLTSILGFSHLIMDSLEEGSPIRADVNEIVHAGERAAKLTRQLLAFGRKQIMQVRPLDINEVVVDMDQLLRRTLGEDVELVTVLGEQMDAIEADQGLLEQVVMNLAVNARDAMPKGGKLTIATTNISLDEKFCQDRVGIDPGKYVQLTVSDIGGGMQESVREHAFEPFYTTKEKDKGTGLGLSTVYGIVKQCKGHVELSSEVGVGTEVRIYLPSVERPAESLERKFSSELPHGSETILVVEDEDTVRHLTVRMLKALGYHVLEARHGGEALLICERYKDIIHLVLTDVVMPHVGGHELMLRLHNIRENFKILYISGFTDDRILSHGIDGQEAPLLLKPYTNAALAQKVRSVLDD